MTSLRLPFWSVHIGGLNLIFSSISCSSISLEYSSDFCFDSSTLIEDSFYFDDFSSSLLDGVYYSFWVETSPSFLFDSIFKLVFEDISVLC